MNEELESRSFFIGWDVGAWHCDRSTGSQDAIVILDGTPKIVGRPWSGNLKELITLLPHTPSWIKFVFTLCNEKFEQRGSSVTMAIDAPLGFPQAMVRLASGGTELNGIDEFETNPYLFRETERWLRTRKLAQSHNRVAPLSAIQDQIGSQATKAMYAIAKFAPRRQSCGVWSDEHFVTAIETYPAPCNQSPTIQSLRAQVEAECASDDQRDALSCALIAWLFATQRAALVDPPASIPAEEGWIWLPNDCFEAAGR